MEYETLLVEERKHIFIVTLNRPEACNALSTQMWEDLKNVTLYYESNPELRVMILTNTGNCFCAGSDLKEVAAGVQHPPVGYEDAGFAFLTGHFCPKPIISAVNGKAVGGGGEILMASDLTVISSDGMISFPEVHVGLLAAGGGGLLKIGRSIPLKFAAEMVLTGDMIDAQTALSWGLVNRVAEPGEVLDTAIALAERILRNSPAAVSRSKFLLYDCMDKSFMNLADGWRMMVESDRAIKQTPEAHEGETAFAETRDPNWMD